MDVTVFIIQSLNNQVVLSENSGEPPKFNGVSPFS